MSKLLPVVGWADNNSPETAVSTTPGEVNNNNNNNVRVLADNVGDTHEIETAKEEEQQRGQDTTTTTISRATPRHLTSIEELNKDNENENINEDTSVNNDSTSFDLTMLKSSALCPQEYLLEPDTPWTWESVIVEMQQQHHKK